MPEMSNNQMPGIDMDKVQSLAAVRAARMKEKMAAKAKVSTDAEEETMKAQEIVEARREVANTNSRKPIDIPLPGNDFMNHMREAMGMPPKIEETVQSGVGSSTPDFSVSAESSTAPVNKPANRPDVITFNGRDYSVAKPNELFALHMAKCFPVIKQFLMSRPEYVAQTKHTTEFQRSGGNFDSTCGIFLNKALKAYFLDQNGKISTERLRDSAFEIEKFNAQGMCKPVYFCIQKAQLPEPLDMSMGNAEPTTGKGNGNANMPEWANQGMQQGADINAGTHVSVEEYENIARRRIFLACSRKINSNQQLASTFKLSQWGMYEDGLEVFSDRVFEDYWSKLSATERQKSGSGNAEDISSLNFTVFDKVFDKALNLSERTVEKWIENAYVEESEGNDDTASGVVGAESASGFENNESYAPNDKVAFDKNLYDFFADGISSTDDFMHNDTQQQLNQDAREKVFSQPHETDFIDFKKCTARFNNQPFTYSQFTEPVRFSKQFERNLDDEVTARSYHDLSEEITNDIANRFGGLDRVSALAVLDGIIIVNGVSYQPQLPDFYMDSMPFDIRANIQNGGFAWLFNFKALRKMSNLSNLMFNDKDFVYSKVRKDLGFAFGFEPSSLFGVCKRLQTLQIGEVVIDIKQKKAFDGMFRCNHRAEEIYTKACDLGWNATKMGWGSIKDVWRDPNRSCLSKAWGILWRGVGTTAAGTSTATAKVGGSVFKSIKSSASKFTAALKNGLDG